MWRKTPIHLLINFGRIIADFPFEFVSSDRKHALTASVMLKFTGLFVGVYLDVNTKRGFYLPVYTILIRM